MKKSDNSYELPSYEEWLREQATDTSRTYNTVRDQSIKADGNKLRMELIPTSAYIGLGRVLTHGAEKYSPNSWQNVEYERYIGALIRHLVAFIDDPTGRDTDSGLLHIEHLLANAVFLNDAVSTGRIPTNERP